MRDNNELLEHAIQQNLININNYLDFIYDFKSIKDDYIYLYKLIKNKIKYLNNFLEYAKEKFENHLHDKQSGTKK